MISTIIAIHDKVMDLFRMRRARRRRIFEEQVKPTLIVMRAIPDDYRNALQEVRKQWKAGAEPVSLADSLLERKWKTQPDRDQLRPLLKAMGIWKPRFKAAFDFVVECDAYFTSIGSNSVFSAVIWQLKEKEPSLRWFEYGQGLLEDQWQRICSTYAALEAEVVMAA